MTAGAVRSEPTVKIGPSRTRSTAVVLASLTVGAIVVAAVPGGLLGDAALGLLVLAVVTVFWQFRARPSVIVGVLIGWFSVQKMAAILVAPYVPSSATIHVLLIKEFMYLAVPLVGAAAYVLASRAAPNLWKQALRLAIRMNAADVGALALLAIVGFSFLLSSAPEPERFTYARRLGSLPLIYLGARLLPAQPSEFRLSTLFLAAAATGVAIFGLVEFLVGRGLWVQLLQVGEFQRDLIAGHVLPPRSFLIDGMPANWTTHFAGVPIRRLVSLYAEPTTLSSFLALSLALTPSLEAATGFRRRWSLAYAAVVSAALVLTLGKGGLLTILVVGLVVAARPARRSFLQLAAGIGAVVIIVAIVGSQLPINVDRHAGGLLSGLESLVAHPMGLGIGATGGFGADSGIGTDSTIGVLASQLGLLGLAAWTVFVLGLARELLPTAPCRAFRLFDGECTLPYALSGAMLGLFAVSLFSESATGLLGNAFYFLVAGWALVAAPMRDPLAGRAGG